MRSQGIEVGQRFESQGLWRRTWQVEQVYTAPPHDIRHVKLRDVGDRFSVRTLAPGALLDRKRFRPVAGGGKTAGRLGLAEAALGNDQERGGAQKAAGPDLADDLAGGEKKRDKAGKKQQRDKG